MTRNAFLASAFLLAAACSSAPPAAPTTAAPSVAPTVQLEKVDLYRFNGKFVASVELNGRPVTAWVRGSEAGLTEEGKPILGVSYSATPGTDAATIEVVALANEGNAKTEEDLKKVPVGTYRVGPGQSINVEGLSKFGMPPMMLRGVARMAEQ